MVALWDFVRAWWKPLLFVAVVIIALNYRISLTKAEASLTKVNRELKLAKEDIDDMSRRQRDVAALDAKYTKELADAKAENDALQRKLDSGGRVLVKGRCPVPASTKTASTSSMGNDATIELSDVAGRNILGIRSGIISDQKALKALQEYINTQCLK
ncbi:lysis protein [Cronobacter turicensis]|uniref:lysis protein n=1 Tax=Cronobacter TaxID=413496 RepID=UPI000CFB1983|nr:MULTISPECIES: lysis protein [Cronobacter]EGT5682557.1 lysis protein [Cronobacter turicensis]EGT5738946.1 lysis protein [Cronobacter turicensis]ELY2738297.1 lysis protein [Cronobacter dublinensis]ELY2820098.1 lysis protein [Cronobacter dublinensis]ELY6321323.1 lysis protein [Cronobacter turicensis]